jgi:Mn-dependent DtxR family transcriptional regulator
MSEASQYLLVVHIVERRESGPVAPGTIAAAVDRSPAAVTEMLQRLDERGLVVHEPYEGATLTAEGRETAAELYESYTTLARFFGQVLDLADPEREALQLAGAVSPAVAERLAETLLEADAGPPDEQPIPSFLRSHDSR